MYKIVIVDDEVLVRAGFKTSVDWQKHGYKIVGEASNGVEALEKIKALEPHIVITDIKMPVMDGIELIKNIRKYNSKIIVIVLSNYNDFELVREALTSGANDYFLKVTIDIDRLLELLNK